MRLVAVCMVADELRDQDTLLGFRWWILSRLELVEVVLLGLMMLLFSMLGLRVLERRRVRRATGRVEGCRR